MTSLTPSRIGARYHVLERLGHGGMAVVYRVRDSSGGELALKQLKLPDDPSRARELTALFEREFYTLAQLSHPSVIEAYDFGVDSSGPYYTMELLGGGDLTERAPLEPREACRLFAQVCSSLCVLHARRLVHRDISPRNVRFTPDGRAKLIDFGALLDMGPCTHTIGTPGFTAPEVVQHVAIDARTDLFSLGATLYYALTKRSVFPVRTFAELRAAWRAELVPPSRLVPGVPPALDALVLSLLRIDPALRPSSTFEVMQRLAAIAGVAQAESELGSQAYLTTPNLVGRDAELRRFRKQLRKAVAGRGGGVAFEGAPGHGRSRVLDACVLEAKTVGAIVLRASGSAASRPFVAAHALAAELLEALPEPARRSAEASGARELLLTDEGTLQAPDALAIDRTRTLAALLAFIQGVCREQPLVLAADDAEQIDEASLALLASLAHAAAEARLLVVVCTGLDPDAGAPAALGILRSQCAPMRLAPLTQEQIEQLFASIFGAIPNLAFVSARIHQLAEGSPRESLALAQQLLETGRIRYADGQWVLPAELTLNDLPASLEEALRARIALLPPLALRLAQTQALALGGPWTRADYAELAEGELGQVDSALAALLKHGLLVTDGRSYTIGAAVRTALISQLTPAELAARHLALAGLCVRSGRPAVLEVHHRLLGGEVTRALDQWTELLGTDPDRSDVFQRSGLAPLDFASCLENAFERSVAQGRPPRERHELARMLTSIASVTHIRFHRTYAPDWLARLERDSGLCDFRELTELEPQARLMTALTRAAQRYEATAPAERVYRVDEAIKYLARYVVMSFGIGARTRDLGLLASLPGLLEPFASLSPVLRALWQDALMVREIVYEARVESACERAQTVYDELGKVEGDQLKYASEIRSAIAYALALGEVMLGKRTVDRWLEVLDGEPRQRADAENLRSLAALFAGEAVESERHRKRAEMFALQAGEVLIFGTPVHIELGAHVTANDLASVRRLADRVAQRAATEPLLIATQLLAEGWYLRLRGDLTAALGAFERCLELNPSDGVDPPPCGYTRPFALIGSMQVLVELGRASEARERGLRELVHAHAQQTMWRDYLGSETALAEAALGDHAAAAARVDAIIAGQADRYNYRMQGVYEARARIAIAARDVSAAVRFADLATRDLHTGDGHKLLPRHGRLLDEARRAGIDLGLAPTGFETSVLGRSKTDERSELAKRAAFALQQVAPDARPRRILELVCEAAGARAGHLYLAEHDGLSRVASLGAAAELGLDAFASGYFQQQLEDAMATSALTELTGAVTSEPNVGNWTSPSGTLYRLLAFTQLVDGDVSWTGLAALALAPGRPVSPQTHIVARALAGELVGYGS